MGQGKLVGFGILAAIIAAVYQIELPRVITLLVGIGLTIEPLDNFPYRCRRIEHPRLQACEDMWLSESTRQLFLACSESLTRQHWLPNMGHFNVSARPLNEAIVVLDIDEPSTTDGSFPLRVLSTPDYAGIPGDKGRMYPLSLSGVDDSDGSVRLWVVNGAPSANYTTGALLDQAAVGANLTVEVFRTVGPKSSSLQHVHTFAHKNISTPNRVAPRGDATNDFWYANDHGHNNVGLNHFLSAPLGWGDVSYCDSQTCRTVSAGHSFPNGLAHSRHDGRVYVPSSLLGRVYVYEAGPAGELDLLATLDAGVALDNIVVDAVGDMYVAAVPNVRNLLAAYADPHNSFPATTALRLRRKSGGGGGDDGAGDSGYEVFKVIEDGKDGKAEVLPAATSVLHDAKTGRLFFSSVISPFIGVCEKV
ncbi:arylesterase [Microdochium nivale]|nr:arylesterase [Microdochium nivale]